MKIKFILLALKEAKSPEYRPIKYSLFPPLGLATLAGYCSHNDEVEILDEHVENLRLDDSPDIAAIQVYITNAKRAYEIADIYRQKGTYVILGGLHVTSLPDEAALHGDTIFLGPAEEAFPRFLADFRNGEQQKVYASTARSLDRVPLIRRDLIKRERYLVPNSIVATRGCPHHCDFCYKDSFFKGGKSFYTARVDDVLEEIDNLPGRHLYFLDDHLLADRGFASQLFQGMMGMNRVFQGAATVDSILRGNLIEEAAAAGLRSLFVGFETLSTMNLALANKGHVMHKNYSDAVRRLHSLGIMINGSFVFGLDNDDGDVFQRTVDWAIEQGITTATFHILTPYPGTHLYHQLNNTGRIITRDWNLYDTRHVVYKTSRITPDELKDGYDFSYKEFYKWSSIGRGSFSHDSVKQMLRHFSYTAGWKKCEPLWNFLIKRNALPIMVPLLENLLSKVRQQKTEKYILGGDKKMILDHVK